MTDLLRKDTKWEWSAVCVQAFDRFKSLLCNSPIPRAPDFTRPFVLAVDASCVGVGAVLLQEGEDEAEHPVAFFSKKLSPAQKYYSVIEQELLGILLVLQHFEDYLPSHAPVIKIFLIITPCSFLTSSNLRISTSRGGAYCTRSIIWISST